MPRRKRRHWGTGEIKPMPNGTFAVRWREDGKKRQKGGFTSEELARRVLAKIRGDIATERGGLPADPRGFPALAVHAEAWLDRRELTHPSSNKDERGRWKNHLDPHLGHLRPSALEHSHIRRFAEEKLRARMNPGTLRLCIMQLSTFYSDLCERPKESGVTVHPVKSAPKTLRALWRSTHDPRLVPFIERMEDVARLYFVLPEPFGIALALGAFEGLRTGEVLAVDWPHLDLERQRHVVEWQVAEGKLTRLKDREARILPIPDTLVPILKAYQLKTGGRGLLFPPRFPGRIYGTARKAAKFMREQTLAEKLREGLRAVGLPEALTWYQCTRHTFASHYIREGGSLEKLAGLLGHSSTEVTKRYAHLRPEHFTAEDMGRLKVDLSPGGRLLSLPLPGDNAHETDTFTEGAATNRKRKSL